MNKKAKLAVENGTKIEVYGEALLGFEKDGGFCLKSLCVRLRCFPALLMTMASAHSSCVEAARASALASHSAASLAAAAGYKEAARLLRSSEALSRAAVASLTAARTATMARSGAAAGLEPKSPATVPAASAGALPVANKKRHKKKKKMKDEGKDFDAVMGGGGGPALGGASPWVDPLAGASRNLAKQTSRERSPRRPTSPVASTSPSSGVASVWVPCRFAEGQAVVIGDLVGRPELNGQVGSVLSADAQSDRVAVKLGSGESVKVRVSNLRSSIFPSGLNSG